jgi:flavin-dependent dehydrogenase
LGSSVSVQILGGGPAGSAAAVSALSESRSVHIFEKSSFPRHKVCGEFLSPEIAPLLESLGIWQEFLRLGPVPIRRTILHFGARSSESQLPDGAFGLSRYEFDRLLFEKAIALGATTTRERVATNCAAQGGPKDRVGLILATGRKSIAVAGRRLFGFKAHFEGPTNDAVELFFFRGCYVGVSAIENGMTNICGIAPEHVLRACEFHVDDLLTGWPPLACRVGLLSRVSRWYTVGPLVFGGQWQHFAGSEIYPAGDALGFIDPFTGLGLVNAVGTGRMAGLAAARRSSVEDYLSHCRRAVRRPFYLASLFRSILEAGLAQGLGPLIPARYLFRMTRAGALVA